MTEFMTKFFFNLRLIGRRTVGRQVMPPRIPGSWYVDPAGPDRDRRVKYARQLLADARSVEPDTDWSLETRGTDTDWHKMEEPNANR